MRIGNLLGQLGPIFVIGVLALVATAVLKGNKTREKPRAKQPMTEREQAMFFRLQQTFPDLVVMPQMAMSALLTAKAIGTRNTFDRKVADFVVCTKSFNVVCVIELDDASHRNKGAKDKARDAMLQAAGYKTTRFKNIPDVEPLKKAIQALTEPMPPKT
jgi:very-short-patch-repair endonuclease